MAPVRKDDTQIREAFLFFLPLYASFITKFRHRPASYSDLLSRSPTSSKGNYTGHCVVRNQIVDLAGILRGTHGDRAPKVGRC